MRRTFWVTAEVSGEFLRDQPELARHLTTEMVRKNAAQPLRGPRGGIYLPVGEPYDFRDSNEWFPEDWMQNIHRFGARVQARYVRPSRAR